MPEDRTSAVIGRRKRAKLNVIKNMGISTNSHGKKSDKETQSPLLKIFKEIMMREDDDPEKRNLLDQEKKRKQYSASRAKVNRRSCESSSSEHRKRSPYKTLSNEQRHTDIPKQSQHAFCSEKKGHWWRKDTCEPQDSRNTQTKNEDDTCSCVSCALRRIVSSEYACIACLIILFSISIVAAFCLVYKNVPTATASSHRKVSQATTAPVEDKFAVNEIGDSERLKRKIDIINDSLMKNELREEEVFGKPHYDEMSAGPLHMPGSAEIDFEPSFRELNVLDGGETKRYSDSDISSIIDSARVNEQSSDKLKEFYKKLVQTDAMIKNLKNIKFQNPNNVYNDNYESKTPDRFKRSLKVFNYPKKRRARRRRRDIYNRPHELVQETASHKTQLKLFANETGDRDPTAFVIEKKKLIVQYKPLNLRKLVPKCSHVPKEQQTHEHHLKHPFYQNTQRLDELLDRFLNKNLPEIVADPFGFDSLFQREKNRCKHPSSTQRSDVVNINSKPKGNPQKKKKITSKTMKATLPTADLLTTSLHYKLKPTSTTTPHKGRMKIKDDKKHNKNFKSAEKDLKPRIFTTPDISKLLHLESSTQYERKFYQHEADMIRKEDLTVVTASPNDFELLLSVSTLMNPEIVEDTVTGSSTDSPLINKVPNIRRLMQIDGEEEENLGYEDFKEVLTDNMENQDDNEGRGERKKRNYDTKDEVSEITTSKLRIRQNQPIDDKVATPKLPTVGEWTAPTDDTTSKVMIKDEYTQDLKMNPPNNNLNNPNWKGPMPLYPDELSSMLSHKPVVINKLNTLSSGSPKTEAKQPINKQKRSDIEYVEDYLDDKYDRLVEMAQAYSDYGVLEGKKENVRNDKHPATNNKISGDRVKLAADENFPDRDLIAVRKESDSIFYPFCIQRKEKTTTTTSGGLFSICDERTLSSKHASSKSEGFRFEVRPSQSKKENILAKLLQSHIRLDTPEIKNNEVTKTRYTPISVFPKTQLLYSPKYKINSIEEVLKKKMPPRDEISETPNSFFSINKKRTLLSTLFKVPDYDISQDRKEPLYESFTDDDDNTIDLDNTRVTENFEINNERAKETSNTNTYNERNNYLKNIVSKYIRIDNQSTPSKQVVILNLDNFNTTKNDVDIMDYVSHLTKSYIKVFSFPYMYTEPQQITVLPLTSVTDPQTMLYETESNISSDLEQPYPILNQILNTTDATVSMKDIKIEPIKVSTDETNLQGQLHISLKHPNIKIDDIKLKFEMPFPYNYSDLTYGHTKFDDGGVTVTPSLFLETSTNAAEIFQVAKRIRRFKRHFGTAKTVLEKSNVTINESPLGLTEVNKNVSINNTQHIANASFYENVNPTHNNKSSNITISDFFMMISNWFKALEGINVNDSKSRLDSGCGLTELLLQLNNNANKSKHENRSTTDSVYPLYDSEMIDNIGHRSRVLLSIQEENVTTSANRIDVDDKKVMEEKANVTGTENKTIDGPTSSTISYISVNKTMSEKPIDTVSEKGKKGNSAGNKVKRNADDSNLISWNDIYDDEYGIQTDNFNHRDKYSKEQDFIRRSGRWMQDKIKKIAENLKGHVPEKIVKRRTLGNIENVGIVKRLKDLYRKSKRQSDEEEYSPNQKAVFNSLENNMIEVCRKAANAVKQTRNANVKEERSQGTIAASLMQQLVRLLTDLVDYQVEQKTCCQLPPDLKIFLEWLTKPEEDFKEKETFSSYTNEKSNSYRLKTTPIYSRPKHIEEVLEEKPMEYSSTTEKFTTRKELSFRSQYLESMRLVQELLDEFEEMSDEEKSKMTGVKHYLQNQLHHLSKQVSGFDVYNLYQKTSIPLRYKRGLRPRTIKNRRKRKHYKFVRNFGKKHTRTTASFYDGIPISEKKKKEQDTEDNRGRNSKVGRKHSKKRYELTLPKRDERNLKDVYYKAVAEAKKYSTALTKNGHSKHQEVDYTATTSLVK